MPTYMRFNASFHSTWLSDLAGVNAITEIHEIGTAFTFLIPN